MPPCSWMQALVTASAAHEARAFAWLAATASRRRSTVSPSAAAADRSTTARVSSTWISRSAARCCKAWKLPTGRPNCSRTAMYCTLLSSARPMTPSNSAEVAIRARSRARCSTPSASAGPATSCVPATSTPSHCNSPQKPPSTRGRSRSARPGQPASTSSNTGPCGARADTTNAPAAPAAGRKRLTPSRTKPPSRGVARRSSGRVVWSCSRSCQANASALSPRASAGNQRLRSTSLSPCSSTHAGSRAPPTSGSGASARPHCSSRCAACARLQPVPP